MTPAFLLRMTVRPTLAWLSALAERPLASRDAEWLLLAIAWQESGLRHRVQVDREGRALEHLARGWWQFERTGTRGVAEALAGTPAGEAARAACGALGYRAEPADVHLAVAHNDVLACCLARALLWTHPEPLPQAGLGEATWAYYHRLWRPGRPRPGAWAGACDAATSALRECGG